MEGYQAHNEEIKHQSPINTKNIDIFSCAEETINLFYKFMSESYAKSIHFKNLEDDLAKFYDGLIWAEKKNPLLVYQIFEMKALNQIIEKYVISFPLVLLRGSILLIGNCEAFGLVAEQILEYRYPDFLMENLFLESVLEKNKEEIEEYIGNFLKCYHRLFKVEWLPKFILNGVYFQLMEINLKFFNCVEFLSRTSGLNIVLDLLKYPEVRDWISNCEGRSKFYYSIFDNMTKLFKNELAEFGLRIEHISANDNVDMILGELEDKIALWEDISANCSGIEKYIQSNFYENVILPLIIGPLKSKQHSLFTLKFSLFVSKKLFPIMKNFGILDKYIQTLFFEETTTYSPNKLNKAIIEPFRLSKLLSTDLYETEEEEDDEKESKLVQKFYETLFTSKDNNTILMINSLEASLFEIANRTEEEKIKKLGLSYGGKVYLKSGKNLIKELMENHRLSTIESILKTLVTISDRKYLDTELQNYFIEIFHKIIENIKNYLKLPQEVLHSFIEVLEYDIQIVDQIEFGKEEATEKYEDLFKVVFMSDKQNPQTNQFYFRLPQTESDFLRYNFIKFMLLRKAKQILLESYVDLGLSEKYYSEIITKSPFIMGDIYSESDLKSLLLPCEVITNKTSCPLFFLKDDNFFVLAMRSKTNQIEILEGIAIKHVALEEVKKVLKISIKEFSSEKCEIVIKKSVNLKGKSEIMDHIKNRIRISINKHLALVRGILEKTENQIPETSLI